MDIKPGQTVEGVYVSLRQRGKILKGQGNSAAPILTAKEKVLLLPERSIRIIKEYLVGLIDNSNTEINSIVEENQKLKEEGNRLFTKIKEQHERDKLLGSESENAVKQELKNYEQILEETINNFINIDTELNEISNVLSDNFEIHNDLGKENYTLLSKYLSMRRKLNKAKQEINNLTAMLEGTKTFFGERYRKKQRVIEKQEIKMQNLDSEIENTKNKNVDLAKEVEEKETKLNELGDTFESLGIQELDSQLEENIKGYIKSQNLRRELQEEGEEFPSQ